MSGRWRLDVTETAARDVRRLDSAVRDRVVAAFERLAEDWRQCDVRKLHGSANEWRMRVGDWRVRFELDETDRVIRVLRVLHRSQAYRR